MRTITESESTPKADGFFMPAEFAPQDRVWMGWPHRTDTWAHGAKPAQEQYANVARAIAEFTLLSCAPTRQIMQTARPCLRMMRT